MENASKALIIAGAILLSILIISLGIMIYGQAESAINGSGMSEAQLHAFNQKFLKYDGTIKGSTVRSLAQEVMANNNSEQASDETVVSLTGAVTLSGTVGASDLVYTAGFKNTKTYNITFTYTKGRISSIAITPVTNN